MCIINICNLKPNAHNTPKALQTCLQCYYYQHVAYMQVVVAIKRHHLPKKKLLFPEPLRPTAKCEHKNKQ